MSDVVPREGITNLLNAALRSDNPVKARLAKNAPTLTPATVLGDFTEATFPGYSAQVVSPMDPPTVQPDGVVSTQSIEANFHHSGGVGSETITVFYVTLETGTGPALIMCGKVDDGPVVMANVSDTITFTVEIRGHQE